MTLDAMGCQRNIAREIIGADVQYELALKGNQTKAHEEIKSYLDDAIDRHAQELDKHQTVEKDHGRIEQRTYWQSDRLDWFEDRDKWEGLRSVENYLSLDIRRKHGRRPKPVRTGHAAENLANLRRLTLNPPKSEKTRKQGIKGKQNSASWASIHNQFRCVCPAHLACSEGPFLANL